MNRKSWLGLGMLVLIALGFGSLYALPPVEDGSICEICYDVDLCIPVPGEFGYATCEENKLKCKWVWMPNDELYYLCTRYCHQSNPCLLPPP